MRWALLALLLVPCVQAAEWKPIGSTNEMAVSFDPASVGPRGKYIKAWTRWDFTPPKEAMGQKIQYTLELHLFHCGDRTKGLQQYVNYSAAEPSTVVSKDSARLEDVRMHDVIPGTYEEAVLEAICAYAKQSSSRKPSSPSPAPR